jgi:hypothetical protein
VLADLLVGGGEPLQQVGRPDTGLEVQFVRFDCLSE